MQISILQMLFNQLLGAMTPEVIKKVVDAAIDKVEELIADSNTQTDDKVLIPIIKLIRTTFDIPDNDEAPPAA